MDPSPAESCSTDSHSTNSHSTDGCSSTSHSDTSRSGYSGSGYSGSGESVQDESVQNDSSQDDSAQDVSGQDDSRTTTAEAPGSEAGSIGLTVNGETRRCPAGLMLPQVLEALGYRPQLVVVEFNGAILPRQRWPEQSVGESDVLEVVTIVGGGS